MTEQIIPSREKLPLDYPLPMAIRIYAARLGVLLVVVLANLIAFVAVFIIANWVIAILGFLVLIAVLLYATISLKKTVPSASSSYVYCSGCGGANHRSARFCGSCGQRLP